MNDSSIGANDRYLACTTTGEVLLGDENGYVPLSEIDPALETLSDGFRAVLDGDLSIDGPYVSPIPAEAIAFATPLAEPGSTGSNRLLGIGLNYADHAADLDESPPAEPATFLKPRSALTAPGGPIRLPAPETSERVTAEAELAVVIGRTCRDLSAENAGNVIAGYLPVIDLTAEDVLERNPRFLTRAKGYDTFLVPAARVTVLGDGAGPEVLGDIEVRTVIDNEVVAANTVSDMHHSPAELVAFCSQSATLRPGDVIATGTPGAGVVAPGDTVRAEVDRIGTASAPVIR